jgi:microcystin-dependent protein
MDGFLGEIRLFAADFAPKFWAFCHGQLLPINQNTALWNVIRNAYGGDGFTTFALPDYRGRAPIGFGSGNSLSTYTLGQQTGQLSNTLTIPQLPAHTHPVTSAITNEASTLIADTDSPTGHYFAGDGATRFDNQHDGVTMSNNITLTNAGTVANTAIMNMMPYQAIHFIICIAGTYPFP